MVFQIIYSEFICNFWWMLVDKNNKQGTSRKQTNWKCDFGQSLAHNLYKICVDQCGADVISVGNGVCQCISTVAGPLRNISAWMAGEKCEWNPAIHKNRPEPRGDWPNGTLCIIHEVLKSHWLLALMDNANSPMSVCLRVPLEPWGKPTGPLTKSSVKFCEAREAHQFVSAQTATGLLARFLKIWGYFNCIISKQRTYIYTNKVSFNIYFGATLLYEWFLCPCISLMLYYLMNPTPSFPRFIYFGNHFLTGFKSYFKLGLWCAVLGLSAWKLLFVITAVRRLFVIFMNGGMAFFFAVFPPHRSCFTSLRKTRGAEGCEEEEEAWGSGLYRPPAAAPGFSSTTKLYRN